MSSLSTPTSLVLMNPLPFVTTSLCFILLFCFVELFYNSEARHQFGSYNGPAVRCAPKVDYMHYSHSHIAVSQTPICTSHTNTQTHTLNSSWWILFTASSAEDADSDINDYFSLWLFLRFISFTWKRTAEYLRCDPPGVSHCDCMNLRRACRARNCKQQRTMRSHEQGSQLSLYGHSGRPPGPLKQDETTFH